VVPLKYIKSRGKTLQKQDKNPHATEYKKSIVTLGRRGDLDAALLELNLLA
jgi:hypothetical protein